MTFFKNSKAAFILSGALMLSIASSAVHAEAEWVMGAKIVTTLADKYYGGCMVALDRTVTNENGTLAGCPGLWLSLDCDAVHRTQAQANAIWTSALVAFSLQKKANFFVDDSFKFNGYCVARRIDVSRSQ